MKKLLYLICLLSFGQIFSADDGREQEALEALLMLGGNPGKRAARDHDDQLGAKRQQVVSAGLAQSGDHDEEFLRQYCGKDLDSQGELNLHKQICFQRSSSLQAQQNPALLGATSAVSVAAPAQANPLKAGVDYSDSQKITCRLCTKSMPTYDAFTDHQMKAHRGHKEPDNTIKCRVESCVKCNSKKRGAPMTFHNHGNRNRHEELAATCMITGQKSIKKHNCPYCNNNFTRNHDLQDHIATKCKKISESLRKEINHSKFTCPHCCSSNPFKFFVLNDLNKHIEDQHKGKPLVVQGVIVKQQPEEVESTYDEDKDDDSDKNEV